MNYAVNMEHLSKSFGEQKVLTDVCMQLEQGKIYGIIGKNGSGKSVLLKCVLLLFCVPSVLADIYVSIRSIDTSSNPQAIQFTRRIAFYNIIQQIIKDMPCTNGHFIL